MARRPGGILGGLRAILPSSASFALMALIGVAASPFGVLQATLLLMMTEPQVQGRVLGIQELTIGVMPLASLVLGSAAEVIGVVHVALISGTLRATFIAILALRVPALLRYSGHVD
ncbi:hypothetical protein OE766_22380 [Pararhizobium sp. YC-54]|uniref:hypothetical protein n=1 Tax=Pararhizobium sp. YC-54 TaxID=2986920 RepID=UPI0021F74C89|nr:hypothetical protein [Pararhizobium sp. YC-54]MCW0000985.1 hypothetical protein [Pararhizobium sp. YC-54]